MSIAVKICGLNSKDVVEAVIKSGADYAGFVHFQKSPRHQSVSQITNFIKLLPKNIKSVVVMVNPDDTLLTEIAKEAKPDFFQLHGSETSERLQEIRNKFPDIGIIKAISVRNTEDIKNSAIFSDLCDFLLFDARASDNSIIQGGNGIAFDWNLFDKLDNEHIPSESWDPEAQNQLQAGVKSYLPLGTDFRRYYKNWFLAGGLNAKNVKEAIAKTGAKMVDVSSGVETSAGVKDAALIDEFIKVAKQC